MEKVTQILINEENFKQDVGLKLNNKIQSTHETGLLFSIPIEKISSGMHVIKLYGTIKYNEKNKNKTITSYMGVSEPDSVNFIAGSNLKLEGSVIGECKFKVENINSTIELKVFYLDKFIDIQIDKITLEEISEGSSDFFGRKILFDNNNTQAEYIGFGSEKLVITFNPYEHTGFNHAGFGESFLSRYGYDLLVFKMKSDDWYQDLSHEDIVFIVKQLKQDYKIRLGYGSSMGAYAALYFAESLHLDRVLAFSPQYSIERQLVSFEDRWGEEAEKIRFNHIWSKNHITKAIIIYDNQDTREKKHVECINEYFINASNIAFGFSGHPSIVAFAESNQLADVILSLLEAGDFNFLEVKRRNRLLSINKYLLGLLTAIRKRGIYSTLKIFNYFSLDNGGGINISELIDPRAFEVLNNNENYFEAFTLFIIYMNIKAEKINFSDLKRSKNFILVEKTFRNYMTYFAHDHRIKVLHGRIENDEITTVGVEGVLLFGPYIDIFAGKYEITINGNAEIFNHDVIEILFTVNHGALVLIQHQLNNFVDDFSAKFILEVDQAYSYFEVVIKVGGNNNFRLKSIDINLLELYIN